MNSKQFADAFHETFWFRLGMVIVKDGQLVIGSTANQDNPLMRLKGKKRPENQS
jgi:Fe-Mn family superoxide dismutase